MPAKIFRDVTFGPSLVEIERGYFRMGSENCPAEMYLDETPARECSVDYRFSVGQYPVTFEEWLPYVREAMPASYLHSFVEDMVRRHVLLPAVMISWHEANDYCDWLSVATRYRYRLLKEVEWEYVCRAGTETEYWWGDEFDASRANCRHAEARQANLRFPTSYADAQATTKYLTRVDRSGPNPWGIFDLHGNVWEWVEDVYSDRRTQPYVFAPTMGREPFRSLRGGSWIDPQLSLRSAVRSWSDPAARDRNIGFRVARDL